MLHRREYWWLAKQTHFWGSAWDVPLRLSILIVQLLHEVAADKSCFSRSPSISIFWILPWYFSPVSPDRFSVKWLRALWLSATANIQKKRRISLSKFASNTYTPTKLLPLLRNAPISPLQTINYHLAFIALLITPAMHLLLGEGREGMTHTENRSHQHWNLWL